MNAALVSGVTIASFAAFFASAQVAWRRAARRRGAVVAKAPTGIATIAPYFVWVPYVVVAVRPGPSLDVPDAVALAGLALVAGGAAFSIWAAFTLGRHYDLELEVHADHEVVRSGPYAIVRHPVYLGLGVHSIGACLATGNVLFITGTLLVSLPALYSRAAAEEKLLRRELGPAYEAYARDVPMLVPFPR